MPTSRQEIYDRIDKEGIENVKKSVKNMNPTSAPIVDGYIKDYEESRALERREAREEETLHIARKATHWAISATIIASIAMLITIISYIWPP